jgi:hypothetical protein
MANTDSNQDATHLDTRQLSARLHKSPWWVYTNRKREGLTAIKVGRELLFPITVVEEWERAHME